MGQQAERFCSFMEEYAAFMGEMAAQEDQKYSALISNDLARMDKAIAQQQSTLKRLEKLEERRMALQEELGWQDLTFAQVLEQLGEDPRREQLEELFAQTSRTLEQIRYSNDKSMSFAKMSLQVNHLLAPEDDKPYGVHKEKSPRREEPSGTVLQTKI